MLIVTATGSPHQLGLQHGSLASLEISRSLTFYRALFLTKCAMHWDDVKAFALKYHPHLASHFPDYVLEMDGVAQGAGVSYADILALNVRTEIAFGAFSDGCTALSVRSGGEREGDGTSLLAQNWDWNTEQAENLICLKIKKNDGLRIQMITEAGIIGKIGLNSHGVGCTLNAIKARGVSFTKLPCHLALRTVMESSSRADAIAALEKAGVASACHILVADVTGGTGLECSSEDVVRLEMDASGTVVHTNHYVLPHDARVVEVDSYMPDTRFRLRRMGELLLGARQAKGVGVEAVEGMLKDEVVGDGASICRAATQGSGESATLFSIVMDLGERRAQVKMGRPSEPSEELVLDP